MMMASLGRIQDAKSEKVLDILNRKDLFDLVDGDKVIKKMITKLINEEPGFKVALIWNGLKIYKILKDKLGLNPANNFADWIKTELNKNGINTMADIIACAGNCRRV